jgi:putative transposase
MARLNRLFAPGCTQHVLQRCASERLLAYDEADYTMLVHCLTEATRASRVAVHAYVLMPDHMHLLATPESDGEIARLMQGLGRRYVHFLNRRHGGRGALWEGRYRATVLEDDPYALICSRYIESNPARRALVDDATHYRWSSMRHHVGLEVQGWITDHARYWALGNTPFERQARYRELFERPLSNETVAALRSATWHGWALGGEGFLARLAKSANRRPVELQRGRPVRPTPPAS